jgi:WD40 repeat protein
MLTVAWSHNGRYLAAGGADSLVHIWNANLDTQILTYRGHKGVVTGLTWSMDDRYLASCDTAGSMQVWQAADGKLITTTASLGSAKGIQPAWNAVSWSPTGNKIALAGTGNVVVQDALSGKNANSYGNSGVIKSVAWSPDAASIAFSAGGDTFSIWNVAQKSQTSLLSGQATGDIYATAWSPNGKMIATGNADGLVEIWDAIKGRPLSTYRGHADFYPGHFTLGSGYAINNLAWSPNSAQIASASNDKTVQVWRA